MHHTADKIFNFLRGSAVKKCLLLAIAVCFLSVAAQAQNISRPNIVSPGGLQVNSYTGTLFYKRADFYIPVQGLPLDISFAYSSAARSLDQGFGFGWTFSYNVWYNVDSVGGVTICRGDGRQDYFAFVNGAYKSPTGIFDVLSQYTTGKYRLTTTEGLQNLFETATHKKLTRIIDRYGNKNILTYSGNNISAISDSLGHTVSFTWTNNKVTEIVAGTTTDSRKVKYEYNTLGYLVQVRKPLGVVYSYGYGTNKSLNSAADGNGNYANVLYNSSNAVSKILTCQLEQRITYNPAQNKTYVTEVDNNKSIETTYLFDTKGRLINRSGNCCGYNTSYEYDGYNNITKITDGNGGVKVFTYDTRGNVTAQKDQLNHIAYYTYDAIFNQILTQTDKKGNQSGFIYDALGNLTSQSDAFSHTVTYTYDGHGNRLTRTDKKGHLTRYGYDQYGFLNLVVSPAGDTTALLNDSWGNVLSKTNPRHAITQYAYDSLDRLTTVTNALQYATHFTYDANGNRLSVIDPRGKTTGYTYNSQDKIIRITDALNHITAIDYDGFGNMLSKTDANHHITTYGYDNLNRITTQTNAAGEMTGYQYDGAGNKTSIAAPNGSTAQLKYDAANRVTEITDGLGTVSKYSYDANGNKISEQDGKGSTTTYQYDALDRMLSATDALGHAWQYTYDYNDNLVQKTDRKGNITNYSYDSLDRRVAYTDALSHTTSNTFDKAGNVTSVQDANGNTTHYAYNALDQLTQELFADNTTKLYTYDSAANLKTRTDNAGQTTTFRYDDVNRPLLRIYTAVLADTFAYDNTGLLIAANGKDAAIGFTYDAANRVAAETLNGKSTTYTYNIAAGKRTITYPGGRQIERQLDSRNQLTAIRENGGQTVAAYEYDLAGHNTKRTYQNGTVANLVYDADGRVTDLNHNPAHFVDFGYTYDNEGNPTAAQFRHNTAHNEQYSYDNEGQLKVFTKGAAVAGNYNYDGVGNRTTATLNGTAASYTVNNMNAYNSIIYGSQTTLAYDNNGNLTGDGSTTYSYDRENRLIAVNNGAAGKYAYDALGRRIQKIAGGDTTRYFFDGLQVIEERSGSDSIKAIYVWGRWVDDIVSMQRGGQHYFYHTNTLGSVVSVTNGSGGVVERYEYDAFGKVVVYDGANALLVNGSVIGNNYLYTGRELDKESGLYYYRARYYDAVHGRFMQRDHIGYRDGMGIYTYVGNKTQRMIDPTGTTGTHCLNPKTTGRNIMGLDYAGSRNPLNYDGTSNFETVPKSLADYPAVGHDRRYGALGSPGAGGLFIATGAIPADAQFVYEEYTVMTNSNADISDRVQSGILGTLLGLAMVPKTVVALNNPVKYAPKIWDGYKKTRGYDNVPDPKSIGCECSSSEPSQDYPAYTPFTIDQALSGMH